MRQTLPRRLAMLMAAAIATTTFTLRLPADDKAPPESVPPLRQDAGSDSPSRKKRDTYPFRGIIGSIDTTARTLTLEGRLNRRVVQWTDATRVERDGKAAVIEDLKTGDTVGGTLRRATGGGHELAVLIRVGAKPTAADGARSRAGRAQEPGQGEGGAAP